MLHGSICRAGASDSGDRHAEHRARQIEPVDRDAGGCQPLDQQRQGDGGIGRQARTSPPRRALRVQQRTAARVEQRAAAQLPAIAVVQRGFAGFAALGCHHVLPQLHLAQFEDRRGCRLGQREPCAEAEAEAEPVIARGNRGDRRDVDVGGDVQQPGPAVLPVAAQLRQQACREVPGVAVVRDGSSAPAATPPQCRGVAFDELQQRAQRRRFHGRAGGAAGAQLERRGEILLRGRTPVAEIGGEPRFGGVRQSLHPGPCDRTVLVHRTRLQHRGNGVSGRILCRSLHGS